MARAARLARIIGGFALISLGIPGLFLPFLQGIAMILGGLYLLSREFRWARRLLGWVRHWRSHAAAPSADPKK